MNFKVESGDRIIAVDALDFLDFRRKLEEGWRKLEERLPQNVASDVLAELRRRNVYDINYGVVMGFVRRDMKEHPVRYK